MPNTILGRQSVKNCNDDWSHCPGCTSSKTIHKGDGEFECADCQREWSGNYNHYDHEPEINPER